jgi:hypothetical protein
MALADEALLATDPTFQSRVRAAMVEQAAAVGFEANSVTNHSNRLSYAVMAIENLAVQAGIIANLVATDANCISDATAVGTVTLTTVNLAAQAALVTDAHIRAAVTGGWAFILV